MSNPPTMSKQLSASEVRDLRAKHGLTQRQLAALIGASQATVASWESGVRKPSGLACFALSHVSTALIAAGEYTHDGGQP